MGWVHCCGFYISGEDAYIAKLNPQTLDAEWVTYFHHTNMHRAIAQDGDSNIII